MKNLFGLSLGGRIVANFLIGLVAVCVISCSHYDGDDGEAALNVSMEIPNDTLQNHTTITFDLRANISQQAFTRSSITDTQMTDLWLFDWLDGSLVQTIHQTSDTDGFGLLSVSADYGSHTFYFVASRGDSPATDGTVITWGKPSDTFWASRQLNIQPATSGDQAVTMTRVATRFRVSVTDEVPATLKTLSITPDVWYYGIDYTTGLPTASQTTARSVSVPESYIGTTGQLAMTIFGLCGTEEFQTDVAVTALDSEAHNIASITLSSVPFIRNRITSFSGSLFGQTRGFTLDFEAEWLDDYIVNF